MTNFLLPLVVNYLWIKSTAPPNFLSVDSRCSSKFSLSWFKMFPNLSGLLNLFPINWFVEIYSLFIMTYFLLPLFSSVKSICDLLLELFVISEYFLSVFSQWLLCLHGSYFLLKKPLFWYLNWYFFLCNHYYHFLNLMKLIILLSLSFLFVNLSKWIFESFLKCPVSSDIFLWILHNHCLIFFRTNIEIWTDFFSHIFWAISLS